MLGSSGRVSKVPAVFAAGTVGLVWLCCGGVPVVGKPCAHSCCAGGKRRLLVKDGLADGLAGSVG